MKHNGTFYLNNSGSRWIVLKDGKKERITLETQSGKEVNRAVIYYYMFGNFCGARISYKGKKINVFADTTLPD